MTKQQVIDALHFAGQTFPFFMLTAIVMGFAFSYGHAITPYHVGEPSDLIRLSCNYLP